jgi:hypothetical protein
MTVAFDAYSNNGSTACGTGLSTFNHTVAGQNRILMVGASQYDNIDLANPPAYAGVTMNLLDPPGKLVQDSQDLAVWYLIGPALGVNAITYTNNAFRCVCAMSFNGVDQADPFNTPNSSQVSGNTSASNCNNAVNVATAVDELIAAFHGFEAAGTSGGCSGSVCSNTGAVITIRGRHCCCTGVSGVGAATIPGDISGLVNLGVTKPSTTGRDVIGIYVSLRPFLPTRGRRVAYYFNIWDPKPRVRDILGRTVPADKIVADAWIELEGLKLPESEVYATFVQDPSKARIVEVNDRAGNASLKASKSQFADVLIKRASGARG